MSLDQELNIDYHCDFELFGIQSNAKEFKLAWHLNKVLGIELVKSKDIVFNYVTLPTLVISNFTFITPHTSFILLKNKSLSDAETHFLLPEHHNIEYFLMIKNESDTFDPSLCVTNIAHIPIIKACNRVDIDKLTNKENLIF